MGSRRGFVNQSHSLAIALAGTLAHSRFGVTANAVGALSDVGDSDGDQLFRLGRQRAIGEDLSTKCLECVVLLWRKLLVRFG
jgi:hypothetical protein